MEAKAKKEEKGIFDEKDEALSEEEEKELKEKLKYHGYI